MRPRTKRQYEILKYIGDFINNHGYEPSYQQIATHFKLKSKGGVAKHIEALEKKGLLERKTVDGSFQLSLVHQQTAENLLCEIEWFANPGRYNKREHELLYVPKFMVGFVSPHNVRAVTVMDNGMLDNGICEDDIVLVETKSFVRDGEIIAALLNDNDIVLRKYYRMGQEIELVPANDNYETVLIEADKMKIIGIYRTLLRPSI